VYGVGDLVGVNSGGTIVESYANGVAENDGSPWGGGYMGGLVGVNENNGTITGSYFTGTITNNEYGTIAAGGLVGLNQGGTIYLSFSNSVVSGSVGIAGGLVGQNQNQGGYQPSPGVISQSFASGAVTAHNAGGLAGVNGGTILNSYASGAANGGYAGGLVGTNGAVISLSYSTGAATGYYGGLEGYGQQGELNDHSYWDTDTSGITDLSKGAGNIPYDPGITGLTSAQLSGGLPPGFDPNVWGENATINNGLPYLLADPPQ
jgi:hypothetical protein